ncbi:DinB family protein [Lysinibacillus sp. NPDC096418]|uniref:DinB family protein n=1 Tax=Lysinibacillus sp. NPDC096418 TaxID=3364138 RepID=UPI003810C805
MGRCFNGVGENLINKRDDLVNRFKEEIIKHQIDSIEFVKSLNALSEKEWRTQIEDGKWTVAEIIGHFKPWDEFILHERLPYLFSEHELPKGPESGKTNAESATISRAEKQQVTIDKFISSRKELYKAIVEIPNDRWAEKFSIGNTTLSLYEYFRGLAQHDHHHFDQIKNSIHLEERGNPFNFRTP